MGTFHLVCTPLSIVEQLCLDGTGDDERRNALLGLEKCLKGNRTITSRRRRRSLSLCPPSFLGDAAARPSPNSTQAARSAPCALRRLRECIRRCKREEAFDLRRRASSASLPPAAAASRAVVSPRSDALFPVRTPIRCDLSHVEHGTFDAVAQRTSLVEGCHELGEAPPPPNRPLPRSSAARKKRSHFFSLLFFALTFFLSFNLFPPFFIRQAKSTARSPVPVKSAARPRRSPSRTRRSSPRSVFWFFFLFWLLSDVRPPPRHLEEEKPTLTLSSSFLSLLLPSLPPPSPPPKKTQ